jgi:hypothetical protein
VNQHAPTSICYIEKFPGIIPPDLHIKGIKEESGEDSRETARKGQKGSEGKGLRREGQQQGSKGKGGNQRGKQREGRGTMRGAVQP